MSNYLTIKQARESWELQIEPYKDKGETDRHNWRVYLNQLKGLGLLSNKQVYMAATVSEFALKDSDLEIACEMYLSDADSANSGSAKLLRQIVTLHNKFNVNGLSTQEVGTLLGKMQQEGAFGDITPQDATDYLCALDALQWPNLKDADLMGLEDVFNNEEVAKAACEKQTLTMSL